ncbi:MAG: T9SS type A sorting domain-containing protein [Flavobacteriales bacterium]|nr:T9SS type A sorting domain-containing protein [Flavobacteriales bacterium]
MRALNTSGLSTMKVFDVTGRTVYNEQSQLNKGADHVMDLTGLTAGNYNVRVTANGVRTTQRLVIK